MKIVYLMYLFVIALLSSCADNTGSFGKYYSNLPGVPQLKSIPSKEVSIERVTSQAQFAKRADALRKQGYVALGASGFDGILEDERGAVELAAREGGDTVIICRERIGKRLGSRLAVGSYTPGRTIDTTTDTYGSSSVYGSASSYGSAGYATAYGSAQGTYSGTSYSSTYVPDQTTYVRENFVFDAYSQGAGVFVSPSRLAAVRNNKR